MSRLLACLVVIISLNSPRTHAENFFYPDTSHAGSFERMMLESLLVDLNIVKMDLKVTKVARGISVVSLAALAPYALYSLVNLRAFPVIAAGIGAALAGKAYQITDEKILRLELELAELENQVNDGLRLR